MNLHLFLHMPSGWLACNVSSGLLPGGANFQVTCCLSWQALPCQYCRCQQHTRDQRLICWVRRCPIQAWC